MICTAADTGHRPGVGSMLFQRLQRWPSIAPALGRSLALAGNVALL